MLWRHLQIYFDIIITVKNDLDVFRAVYRRQVGNMLSSIYKNIKKYILSRPLDTCPLNPTWQYVFNLET